MFYIIFIILVWQYRGKENKAGGMSELSKGVCAKVSIYSPALVLECAGHKRQNQTDLSHNKQDKRWR